MTTHHLRHHLRLLPVVLLLALLGACASTGGSDQRSASESAGDAAANSDGGFSQASAEDDPIGVGDKVVINATVSLTADDVDALRADVQRIVDSARGTISEEETYGDDDEVDSSQLVLRVPSDRAERVIEELEDAGTVESSTRSADVVTEQYVDLQARVRAQERSLRRVEVLFDRARSIRDIMSIEGELSRRQADLDSLKGQLQVLEDQTAMATITVMLSRTDTADVESDDAGFLAGLGAGWHALTDSVVVLATVLGAVLPFLIVLAPLAVAAWWLVRRGRARRRTPSPA